MLALDTIFQEDKSAVWLAAKAGVRDIETNTGTYEVKSTIRRTGYDVTINSVYQLDNNKDFWLLFLRMEESKDDGVSINDMCSLLLSHGYDREKLDSELKKQGINRDNHICNIKYRVIERVKFLVDNDFPKIVDSSFDFVIITSSFFPNEVIEIILPSSIPVKSFLISCSRSILSLHCLIK